MQRKYILTPCLACATSFPARADAVARGTAKYCSTACYGRGRSLFLKRPPADRFWAKVQRGPDCWLWQASASPSGYGTFYVDAGQFIDAHRFAWSLASGAPIPGGWVIGHTCDDGLCVRNDKPGAYTVQGNGNVRARWGHLFLGTYADNAVDMHDKGRWSRR